MFKRILFILLVSTAAFATPPNATKPSANAPVLGGGGGGGGAPTTVEYLVGAADATLSAERVCTDSTTIDCNLVTPGQASFDVLTNSISNSLIRQSAGVSVIGRSANTVGNVADIAAAADNDVLRRSAGVVGFGGIDTASTISGTFADARIDGSLEADEVNPTLGTQTQGNFVATVSTTGPLAGGAAGSEGTAISLTTSMATNRLIGRTTATTGPMEEISVGSGLTLSALILDRAALTGDVTASAGSNTTTVANVPAGATVAIDGSEVTTGTVAVSRGGTGAAPGADDQVLISDSTVAATWRSIPGCSNGTTDKLLYDTATNTISCGTDQGAGSGITYADAAAAMLAGI